MNFSQIVVNIGVSVVIVVIFIYGGVLLRSKFRRKAVVTAVIEIAPSGDHHIVYLAPSFVDPIDLIQLSLSYIERLDSALKSNPLETKRAMLRFVETLLEFQSDMRYYSQFAAAEYRERLRDLAKIAARNSTLSSAEMASNTTEKFTVSLIRGRKIDYVVHSFMADGYKPNHYSSAVLLYCDIAKRMNDSGLRIQHEAMMRFIETSAHNEMLLQNAGLMANAAVKYASEFETIHI